MSPAMTPPPATAVNSPPPTAVPPGSLAPPGGAPPGESPPTAPFANVLNEQVARTAVAEGQPKTATDSGGHRETRGGDTTQQNDLAQPGAQDGKNAGSLLASFQATPAPVAPVQQPAAALTRDAQPLGEGGTQAPVPPGVQTQSGSQARSQAQAAPAPQLRQAAVPSVASDPHARPALQALFAEPATAGKDVTQTAAVAAGQAAQPQAQPASQVGVQARAPQVQSHASAPQVQSQASAPQVQSQASAPQVQSQVAAAQIQTGEAAAQAQPQPNASAQPQTQPQPERQPQAQSPQSASTPQPAPAASSPTASQTTPPATRGARTALPPAVVRFETAPEPVASAGAQSTSAPAADAAPWPVDPHGGRPGPWPVDPRPGDRRDAGQRQAPPVSGPATAQPTTPATVPATAPATEAPAPLPAHDHPAAAGTGTPTAQSQPQPQPQPQVQPQSTAQPGTSPAPGEPAAARPEPAGTQAATARDTDAQAADAQAADAQAAASSPAATTPIVNTAKPAAPPTVENAPAPTAASAATSGHAGQDAHSAAGENHQDGSASPSPAAQMAQLAGSTTGAPRTADTPPFEVRTPVALPHAAEAVQRAIELAARQGVNQARIELAPASLGSIRIHLQRTQDGLVVRVSASHEAAQSFQQNADDLRRSLQGQGLNLLRLQIESDGGRNAAQTAHGHDANPRPARNDQHAEAGEEAVAAGEPITSSSNGRIDVLA